MRNALPRILFAMTDLPKMSDVAGSPLGKGQRVSGASPSPMARRYHMPPTACWSCTTDINRMASIGYVASGCAPHSLHEVPVLRLHDVDKQPLSPEARASNGLRPFFLVIERGRAFAFFSSSFKLASPSSFLMPDDSPPNDSSWSKVSFAFLGWNADDRSRIIRWVANPTGFSYSSLN
jgi:hypothetical protein